MNGRLPYLDIPAHNTYQRSVMEAQRSTSAQSKMASKEHNVHKLAALLSQVIFKNGPASSTTASPDDIVMLLGRVLIEVAKQRGLGRNAPPPAGKPARRTERVQRIYTDHVCPHLSQRIPITDIVRDVRRMIFRGASFKTSVRVLVLVNESSGSLLKANVPTLVKESSGGSIKRSP